MINRIETEYDPQTHQVQVTYGAPMQTIFRNCSGKISEVVDERTFVDLCNELGDEGPRQLASGAILLAQLAHSNFVSADAAEWNWALTLVSWTILRLEASAHSMGDLPIALVALAYIAPVELPDIPLPAAADALDGYPVSREARTAYEDIRTIQNVQAGSIPTVASATRLWQELKVVASSDPGFVELQLRLESASILFRTAMAALGRFNAGRKNN